VIRARIRRLAALLPALALVASVVLPALHAGHAWHAGTGAPLVAAAMQIEAGRSTEPATCPVCIGVTQARFALGAAPPALDPALVRPGTAPPPAAVDPRASTEHSPAAPRAPPPFA
jgi:hypothetical protein